MGVPNEEQLKKHHQASVEIYTATGWIHDAAKMSVLPGIKTLEEFNRKFPGQLSDRDLQIGRFQKPSPRNKYYSQRGERQTARYQLQVIHSTNDSRSNIFKETLSKYSFVDTQVRENFRKKFRKLK